MFNMIDSQKVAVLIVVLTGLGLHLPGDASAANEVAEIARSLSVGEWQSISPEIPGGVSMSSYLHDGSDKINTWIDSMGYDPVSRCLLAAANAHGGDKYLIKYCLENNAVTKTLLSGMSGGHAYDQNTFCGGALYYLNKGVLWKYGPTSDSWESTSLDVEHSFGAAMSCMPGEAIYITGRLLNGTYGHLYRLPLGGTKLELLTTDLDLPQQRQIAEYVPAADAIIFGGGSGVTAVYRVERGGKISRVADSPEPMVLADAFNGSLNFADPVSSRLYSANRNGKTYLYDVNNDQWSTIGSHPVEVYANGCASIAEYGVVVCLSSRQNAIWVFKTLGESAPDFKVPNPPGDFQ